MEIKELVKLNSELLTTLKNPELPYIRDINALNDIIIKYNTIFRNYLSLYLALHKIRMEKLEKLKNNLKSSVIWNFILKISDDNSNLHNYFDQKYSIENLKTQIKNICNAEGVILTNSIKFNWKCESCKKSLSDLKDILFFDEKTPKDDIKRNILNKMEDSSINSLFSSELLEIYKQKVKSDDFDSLPLFYENLTNDEKKQFLEAIVKFFEGVKVEIIDIITIINQLRESKDKFQGIGEFLNSLKEEIIKHQDNIPKEDNVTIEWTLKL